MASKRSPSDPYGLAIQWVSRILAIGFVMVLFGLGGQFLSRQLGQKWLNPVGWLVGMVLGFVVLLIVAGVWKPSGKGK